jgi:hypothetical protein
LQRQLNRQRAERFHGAEFDLTKMPQANKRIVHAPKNTILMDAPPTKRPASLQSRLPAIRR